MEPASRIIKQLGGDTKVSRALGIHRTRVANWKRPKSSGGTGGQIPQKHLYSIVALAKSMGVSLSPSDFLPENLMEAQSYVE